MKEYKSHQFVNKTLWSLLDVVVGRGISIVYVILLGNLLEPTVLGVYISFALLVSYANGLFSLNIESGIVQKLRDKDLFDQVNQNFTVGLIASASLSLLVILVVYLFSEQVLNTFELKDQAGLLQICMGLIVLEIVNKYLRKSISAFLAFKALTIINIATLTTQVLLSIYLIWNGLELEAVLWAYLISKVVEFLLLSLKGSKTFKIEFSSNSFDLTISLIKFSLQIYLGTIALFLDQNVDLFFVNKFMSKGDLATYNYALKVSVLFMMLGSSISSVTYPIMSSYFSEGKREYLTKIYSGSMRVSLALLTIVGLFTVLFFPIILDLILPSFYSGITDLLLIFLSGIILFSAVSSVGSIFTAMKVPLFGAGLNWIAMLMNVVLNLILIPSYGMTGAAIATTASFTFRSIALLFLVERKVKTSFSYLNFFLFYSLFLASLYFGYYFVDDYIFRTLLLALFSATTIFVFLKKLERGYFLGLIKRPSGL